MKKMNILDNNSYYTARYGLYLLILNNLPSRNHCPRLVQQAISDRTHYPLANHIWFMNSVSGWWR